MRALRSINETELMYRFLFPPKKWIQLFFEFRKKGRKNQWLKLTFFRSFTLSLPEMNSKKWQTITILFQFQRISDQCKYLPAKFVIAQETKPNLLPLLGSGRFGLCSAFHGRVRRSRWKHYWWILLMNRNHKLITIIDRRIFMRRRRKWEWKSGRETKE